MITNFNKYNVNNPFLGKDPKKVWQEIKANSISRDKKDFFKEVEEFLNNSKQHINSKKTIHF